MFKSGSFIFILEFVHESYCNFSIRSTSKRYVIPTDALITFHLEVTSQSNALVTVCPPRKPGLPVDEMLFSATFKLKTGSNVN